MVLVILSDNANSIISTIKFEKAPIELHGADNGICIVWQYHQDRKYRIVH